MMRPRRRWCREAARREALQAEFDRLEQDCAEADEVPEDSLDMAAVGWRPTAEAYLGRVTKGRIAAAVREARGARAAERIANLKKAEMATAAEELLAGTGWVPEPLRTPGQVFAAVEPETEAAPEGEAELAADGGEPAIASGCQRRSATLTPHARGSGPRTRTGYAS